MSYTELLMRTDNIDACMDRTKRLIDSGARFDMELASGVACGEEMTSVQRRIDKAIAAVEMLSGNIRDAHRNR